MTTLIKPLSFKGIDFGVLPILLFFVCIGLVAVVSAAAWGCVVVFGSAADKAVTLAVAANLPVPAPAQQIVADAAISSLSRVPFFISAVLVAVAASTCGAVAVCAGTFIHFLQLFNAYKDYLKLIVRDDEGDDEARALEERKKTTLSSLNLQFTLLLLWAYSALLHLPSLLAWQRGLPDSPQLSPDPSLVPAVLLVLSMAATWGDRAPRPNVRGYAKLAQGIQFLCILIAMYGSVSLYRSPFFASAACVALAIHQLMASKMSSEEVAQREEEKHSREARQRARDSAASVANSTQTSSGEWANREEKAIN